jgi:hypothetical protein
MKTPLCATLAALVLFAAGSALAADRRVDPPEQVITGRLTRADHQTHREVVFTVPPGATRVTVRFRYLRRTQDAGVDIGVFDPERFRGWSGTTRDVFTLSAEEATPGYLPGPLPAGRWRLVLSASQIRPGAEIEYETRVAVETRPRPVEFADAPINPAPGWYRGDFHVHTGDSDGSCAAHSGRETHCPVYRAVETAAGRNLDFVAITDHNTTAHYNEMRELQEHFDKMLLAPGREMTTFFGHANVFGLTQFLEYRMTQPDAADALSWIQAANDSGGLVSVNHPGVATGEECMGCGWSVDPLPPGSIGAVEVVNGGTLDEFGTPEGPKQGFDLWDRLLNQGEHVTGIGGSDIHNPDLPTERLGTLGSPTTAVYMPELSVKGLLAGVRSGRVFIDIDMRPDRLLDLRAEAGPARAEMGGSLPLARGATATFFVTARGVPGGQIEVIEDAALVPALARPTPAEGEASFAVSGDGARHWIRVQVRDIHGRLVLIGNPIYITP